MPGSNDILSRGEGSQLGELDDTDMEDGKLLELLVLSSSLNSLLIHSDITLTAYFHLRY